jgi:hypothetical protein
MVPSCFDSMFWKEMNLFYLPRAEGFESEQDASDRRPKCGSDTGAGTDGHKVTAVPVVLEVA